MPLTREHKYPAPPWHVEPPVKHEDEHSYGYMSYVIRNNEGVYVGEVHQYGEEFAVKAEATANYIISCASENATLRQQLEHSQQLVTDGQEAIGHWQGEYEQLRQRVEELEQDCRFTVLQELHDKLMASAKNEAALTAKLAAVEGELQCGHSAKWYAVDDDANDDCLGCRTIHLQQQLAEVTKEQDDYKKQAEALADAIDQMKVSYQHQLAAAQAKIIALTDALEAGFMKGAYARLSELQHKEQKLYEAEARIRELEQALRLHLAVAKDDPILQVDDGG